MSSSITERLFVFVIILWVCYVFNMKSLTFNFGVDSLTLFLNTFFEGDSGGEG